MSITVKRLEPNDWLTLGPILAALVVWLFVKGFRYVPR